MFSDIFFTFSFQWLHMMLTQFFWVLLTKALNVFHYTQEDCSVCPIILCALLYHYRKTVTTWTSTDVDIGLYKGYVLYQQIGKKGLLLPSHLPKDVMIFNSTFKEIEKLSHISSFLYPNIDKHIVSVSDSTNIFGSNTHDLMCLYDSTLAILKESNDGFYVFDPHARDHSGLPDESGKAMLLHFSSLSHI